MSTDWMQSLGVAATEKAERKPRQMQFTVRDHVALKIILGYKVSTDEDGPILCEISNAKLARELQMTAGAAAARISRLTKLGIIQPHYEVAVETGKVNRRILEICAIPPMPWTPDGQT